MDSILRFIGLVGLFAFCAWATGGDFMETVLLYIAGTLSAILINMRTVIDE